MSGLVVKLSPAQFRWITAMLQALGMEPQDIRLRNEVDYNTSTQPLAPLLSSDLPTLLKSGASNSEMSRAIAFTMPPKLMEVVSKSGPATRKIMAKALADMHGNDPAKMQQLLEEAIGPVAGTEKGAFLKGTNFATELCSAYSSSGDSKAFIEEVGGSARKQLSLMPGIPEIVENVKKPLDRKVKEELDKERKEKVFECARPIVVGVLDKLLSKPADTLPKPILVTARVIAKKVLEIPAGEDDVAMKVGMGVVLRLLMTKLVDGQDSEPFLSNLQTEIGSAASHMLQGFCNLKPPQGFKNADLTVKLLKEFFLAIPNVGQDKENRLVYTRNVDVNQRNVEVDQSNFDWFTEENYRTQNTIATHTVPNNAPVRETRARNIQDGSVPRPDFAIGRSRLDLEPTDEDQTEHKLGDIIPLLEPEDLGEAQLDDTEDFTRFLDDLVTKSGSNNTNNNDQIDHRRDSN